MGTGSIFALTVYKRGSVIYSTESLHNRQGQKSIPDACDQKPQAYGQWKWLTA